MNKILPNHIAAFRTLAELHSWIRENRNSPEKIFICHMTMTDDGNWLVMYFK